MGPIEGVFVAIAIMFGFIGVARGYGKELGSSVIVLVVIVLSAYFEPQFDNLFGTVADRVVTEGGLQYSLNLLQVLAFQGLFIAIVFASYSGEILEFKGKQASAPLGLIYSLAIGLFNGYLIAGTLWYYLDKYGYPIPGIKLPLTNSAQEFLAFLPQVVFPSPVYWMIPVAVLLFALVKG